MSTAVKKIIFTLKKVPRKIKKKRPIIPKVSKQESFQPPDPEKKPVKIIRSLTGIGISSENNEKSNDKQFELDNFFSFKEKESEFLNKYQAEVAEYSLYGYTQTMDHYLRQLLQNSKFFTNQIQKKYDLLFLMKIMIKTFMMNELELIFWSYFLEENKWDYIPCLSQAKKMDKLPEYFHNIYDVDKPVEYKALIMYFYFSCFAIKQLFRNQNDMYMYLAYLLKFFPNFYYDQMDWRATNQKYLTFDTFNLNRVFEKNSFSWKNTEKETEFSQSLDSMVNMILEMSPPYLYERPEFISCHSTHSFSKKPHDFDLNMNLDFKTEFKEEPEKRYFFRSSTLNKDLYGFDTMPKESSFKRLDSFTGFNKYISDDLIKMESNFSLPRADSIRSNIYGNSTNFFNLPFNSNSQDLVLQKSSQETNNPNLNSN